MALTDEIRAACARVAARARHVRIVEAAIEPYARTLPAESPPAPDLEPARRPSSAPRSACTLERDQLRLRLVPDAAQARRAVRLPHGRGRRCGARGPWTAAELAGDRDAPRSPRVSGQDPEHELMALFARALRELGEHVTAEHGGSFLALARSGDGSAVRARRAARAAGRPGATSRPTTASAVPFFKRAQIAAADLAPAPASRPRDDLAALTLFADNLVPHVLRLDGVLEFDDRARRRGSTRERADRARLARGGRDPRLRAARGRAAGRRPRRDDRDGGRQRALAPRRRRRATRPCRATARARPPTERQAEVEPEVAERRRVPAAASIAARNAAAVASRSGARARRRAARRGTRAGPSRCSSSCEQAGALEVDRDVARRGARPSSPRRGVSEARASSPAASHAGHGCRRAGSRRSWRSPRRATASAPGRSRSARTTTRARARGRATKFWLRGHDQRRVLHRGRRVTTICRSGQPYGPYSAPARREVGADARGTVSRARRCGCAGAPDASRATPSTVGAHAAQPRPRRTSSRARAARWRTPPAAARPAPRPRRRAARAAARASPRPDTSTPRRAAK